MGYSSKWGTSILINLKTKLFPSLTAAIERQQRKSENWIDIGILLEISFVSDCRKLSKYLALHKKLSLRAEKQRAKIMRNRKEVHCTLQK